MVKAKKTKRVVGDIVKVQLQDGKISYAMALPHAVFAFFDYYGGDCLDVVQVVQFPVLFRLFVMDYAVTSGRWPVVGHVEPSPEFLSEPTFFKQDPISKRFFIYIGGKDLPATREDIEGLERAVVWDPEHVEDRLMDHYAGRANKWVESMKIRAQ
jgi:hypothetical protein